MCVRMGLRLCFEIEYQVKGEGASHALYSHAGEAPSHFKFAFTALYSSFANGHSETSSPMP